MTIKTIKDNSVLAKLFAEEDIHISYKQVKTAAFDVKKRELILPIMKEMTKDIQDLMTLHEVGHAFWTSLDMLNESIKRKLDHSFVNVLEDIRIEKKIQDKYKGSKKVFNKGYKELIANNFFETKGKDINKLTLIDRINLFYKHHSDIQFTDEEMVWVEKANATKTEKEVLDLAEELHAYMLENMPEQEEENISDDMSAMMGGMESLDGMDGEDSDEDSGEQEGKMIYSGQNFSDEENDDTEESKSGGSEESDEEGDEETSAGSGDKKTDEESNEETKENVSDGSTLEGGIGEKTTKIVAATDQATYKSLEQMRDKNAEEKSFVNIPKVNLKEVIIDYNENLKMFNKTYDKNNIKGTAELRYYDKTLEELETTFKENKKTISYMVKEFEMKKAADQYARASISKTGSLDMGRLHTYKYNDDLFRKVTTLPGATNHGFVMFLDWSGSMQYNLPNTIKQLFNIIWFCNRVKIPFEVYAFTDQVGGKFNKENKEEIQKWKLNDFNLENNVRLLNLFSNNMNKNQQNTMMHNLIMISNYFSSGYRDWKTLGYPIIPPRDLFLGGTPLNHAIVCAMEILPKFKLDTGVQKVHTIFLTDGDSHTICSKFDTDIDGNKTNRYVNSYSNVVITDPITNTKIWDEKDKNGSRWNWNRASQTMLLLKLLKKRVEGMNIVGFFIAGSTRKGSIPKNIIEQKFGVYKHSDWNKFKAILDTIKKENVAVCKSQGYDEFYVLPGKIEQDSSEIEVAQGASKAALKRAFSKSANGKLKNRPLLNKFISMVA